ncbi:unnamed protein product [Trichobilharzia regenti]|nr:unnamed protein product [Trichobilharzia regenti]
MSHPLVPSAPPPPFAPSAAAAAAGATATAQLHPPHHPLPHYEDPTVKSKLDISHNKYLTPPYNEGVSFRRAVSLDKPAYALSSLHEQHQQPQIQQQHQQYQRYQQRQQQPQQLEQQYRQPQHIYSVQTKEKDGFSRDLEKSIIQPHPMPTDIKTDGSKHTADGSISDNSSSSINNHNINKHKFYETTDMNISKPFNASSFDEIIPYDKSIPVTHKEVRISETQPIVAISKKSINLSSNEINIQSKLLPTSHTTPPPTGSAGGGGGSVLKVSVQLGENEIQEFAEYWDHSIFSRARVTAVCLAGVASVCLVCTVCASTWLYQGYDVIIAIVASMMS